MIKDMQLKLKTAVENAVVKDTVIKENASRHQQSEQRAMQDQEKIKALTIELDRLNAKIVAQESLLSGLKEERGLWSKELAAQGTALSADRGKMEAQIAALVANVERLKSENMEGRDALRVKSAILDDHVDSVRTLKQTNADRDREMRALKEEYARNTAVFTERLESEKRSNQEMHEELDKALQRKQELKEIVADLTSKLEILTANHEKQHRAWQEKGSLIGQLEAQVDEIREVFSTKESNLIAERDSAMKAQKHAEESLRRVDDGFRKQIDVSNQQLREQHVKMERLMHENAMMQQQLEASETEMRALLSEAEQRKRAAASKIHQLTQMMLELQ